MIMRRMPPLDRPTLPAQTCAARDLVDEINSAISALPTIRAQRIHAYITGIYKALHHLQAFVDTRTRNGTDTPAVQEISRMAADLRDRVAAGLATPQIYAAEAGEAAGKCGYVLTRYSQDFLRDVAPFVGHDKTALHELADIYADAYERGKTGTSSESASLVVIEAQYAVTAEVQVGKQDPNTLAYFVNGDRAGEYAHTLAHEAGIGTALRYSGVVITDPQGKRYRIVASPANRPKS